ncbi:MAG: Rrf2 family transcriptional regulator [Zetaproteobacteria bacterium]|nr:Rrf2 family transcriptional regulator [Zetaproteobacteria bacterium]
MRLTSKGRYAVSAMVDLAKQGEDKPVTLASISERQCISLSYLEQLFRKLREHGLVTSVRGPGGGYHLAALPSEITVSAIILAVDEPIQMTMCANASRGCHRGHRCDTHQLWNTLGLHIQRFLDVVTVENIINQDIILDSIEMLPASHYVGNEQPIKVG